MTDLNSLLSPASGWTLYSAQGINDLGQIVGYGNINGHTHAFLMSPDSSTATPEPSSLVLFGSGLLGLAAWRRRKARPGENRVL